MLNSVGGVRQPFARLDRTEVAILLLLGIAIIFGGGGVRYGLMNGVVQLSALTLLAIFSDKLLSFWRSASLPLRLLVAATCLLPILQILPLPPRIWHSLPGRVLTHETLTLIGQPDRWMPWSLDPMRTLVALIGLIAPLTILILVQKSRRSFQPVLMQAIVAMGAATLLIGAVQLASDHQAMNWYANGNPHQLYGTFANHNSTGLFLVIALCAWAGTGAHQGFARRIAWFALGPLLLIGVLATQSRSSMALLLIPAMQLFVRALHASRRRAIRPLLTSALPGIILAAALLTLSLTNARLQQSLHRFDDLHDARALIWQDSLVAITRYWPVGSGIGTFDEVFQLDESLENVNDHYAGRAHNEYLELALESGLFGVILCIGWIGYLIGLGRTLILSNQKHCLTPFVILTAIAAQSLFDYPLRNEAILCTAAAMLALLANECERIRKQ